LYIERSIKLCYYCPKENEGLILKSIEQMNSPMQFDSLSNNESVIINRLNDYHLIHTYSYDTDSNYFTKYSQDIVYGNRGTIPLFSSVLEGETFIVSKNDYKQNEKLFDTLRQATRDRIFSRLASGITATYLSNYAKIIETSIPSHPKLKNTNLLDLSVEKIYIKLKNETFLNEKNAWINLYEWFK